jgi:transcriptional regulator with XRE-family HTH domain
MTAVQDARAALGERLRELRRHAGLTGRQLAEALAWPASKVSKLENGRQQPTDADIRGWTEVTGRTDAVEALLASLHTLEEQHAEWQRLLRRGMRAHQDTVMARDARTRMFRAFEPAVVPGLLQTADYARARFAQGVGEFGLHDVDEAVAARMRRQEILYRADKRFHLVLTEATLRYSLCPAEVMLGQLDRLIALAGLPTVQLGVIGFGAVRPDLRCARLRRELWAGGSRDHHSGDRRSRCVGAFRLRLIPLWRRLGRPSRNFEQVSRIDPSLRSNFAS